MIPILSPLLELGSTAITGVTQYFQGKQKIKQAIVDNKARLAQSEQGHNQDWEMKSLENAGYKDDVLFYLWVGFFVWSGFDPESAKEVIGAWEALPGWFLEITFWIIGSVIGVKKVGDYLPGVIAGVKGAFKKID